MSFDFLGAAGFTIGKGHCIASSGSVEFMEFLLVFALGFLGSFGHCVGMCGPLTVAFALSQADAAGAARARAWQQLRFHSLLNLGRVLSYAAVGAALGAIGSLLMAGGQLAGIGSGLRQGMAIFTGLLLIWLGLNQINPQLLPRVPLLHPLLEGRSHQSLSHLMSRLSGQSRWWTPTLLGGLWGLIPCGFLYVAQIKAAATGNLWLGAATMLAFGLGTMPILLGLGVLITRVGADRRSQLFRMGGWITLTMGGLMLLRNDAMVDYTGYGALLLLGLALVARPLSRLLPALLHYRRALGVGAFLLAIAHTGFMLNHTLQWNWSAVEFMLPRHQWGMGAGAAALALMTPAALTSFDGAVRRLGRWWRPVHLLTVPAIALATLHVVCIGSRYLGALEWQTSHAVQTGLLVLATALVLLLRLRGFWLLLSLRKFYVRPTHRSLPASKPPESREQRHC